MNYYNCFTIKRFFYISHEKCSSIDVSGVKVDVLKLCIKIRLNGQSAEQKCLSEEVCMSEEV